MANYALFTGTKAPILDAAGNPLPSAGYTVTFDTQGIAGVDDSGPTLYLTAISIANVNVTVTPDGSAGVTHLVSVIAAPFDWSIGDGIPA